jgi:hypothetical protein
MHLSQTAADELIHNPQDHPLESVILSVGTCFADCVQDPFEIALIAVQVNQSGKYKRLELLRHDVTSVFREMELDHSRRVALDVDFHRRRPPYPAFGRNPIRVPSGN